MSRTAWLGILSILTLALGMGTRHQWPGPNPALACESSDVRNKNTPTAQVAVCGGDESTGNLSPGATMTLGGRLDLNLVSPDDLALISGIGPSLARALIAARVKNGGFNSWVEVDEVKGVGPAKLKLLQRWTYLSPISRR